MNIKSLSLSLLLAMFTGPALGWTITANFDSGALGTKADHGGDGFTGAGGQSTYTNEQFFRGGQAAKLTIDKGQTGYGNWGGEFVFPQKVVRGQTIWYQVYTYFPAGFDYYSYGEGGRLKFMRIQTLTSSGSNEGYDDIYIDHKGSPSPFKWIFEGAQHWVNIGSAPKDLPAFGKWESYQERITLDTVPVDAGGKAEVFIWKDGKLLKHITDQQTLKTNTDYAGRALLFTYWNGGAPQTQSMYVDNITITTDTPKGIDANGNSMIPSLIQSPPAQMKIWIK